MKAPIILVTLHSDYNALDESAALGKALAYALDQSDCPQIVIIDVVATATSLKHTLDALQDLDALAHPRVREIVGVTHSDLRPVGFTPGQLPTIGANQIRLVAHAYEAVDQVRTSPNHLQGPIESDLVL